MYSNNNDAVPSKHIMFMDTLKNTSLPLLVAAENKDGVLKCIIDTNHEVNVVNKQNETPLHLAMKSGNLEITKILLSAGANYNAIDKYDKTPLDYAPLNRISLFKDLQENSKALQTEFEDFLILNPQNNVSSKLVESQAEAKKRLCLKQLN